MKRIGYLWDEFASDANIESAFEKSIKGRTRRRDVRAVIDDKEAKLTELKQIIENWIPSPYKIKKIVDKKKVRELHIPPFFPDRIIQHMINNILEKVFYPTFINDTYQCIKGRGTHKAIKKTEGHIQSKQYDWVLKVDIKKYYPSIDNEILKIKLARKIKDKKFLAIVNALVDSDKGVPVGNNTSQILANIYLTDLDHKMKAISKAYVRYADDFILLGTKSEVKQALSIVKEWMAKNHMILNPSTQYFNIDERPLKFLGFIFRKDYTRPVKRTLVIDNEKNKDSIYGWVKESKALLFLLKVYQDELQQSARLFLLQYMYNKMKRSYYENN